PPRPARGLVPVEPVRGSLAVVFRLPRSSGDLVQHRNRHTIYKPARSSGSGSLKLKAANLLRTKPAAVERYELRSDDYASARKLRMMKYLFAVVLLLMPIAAQAMSQQETADPRLLH